MPAGPADLGDDALVRRAPSRVRAGSVFDNADIGQRCHDRRMEIRHRLGMKRHLPSRAVADLDAQRVVNEIEVDLERPFAIRYG